MELNNGFASTCGGSAVSLRLSVVDKCQLECRYCKPEKTAVRSSTAEPGFSSDMPLTIPEIIRFVKFLGMNYGLDKVRLTGGEPLLRRDIVEIVTRLKVDAGVKNVAMTTNAQKLAESAGALARAGLGRVNVSLDTLSPEKYRSLTVTGELSPVLKGIEAAERAGLTPIKVNTVVLRDFNFDEIADIAGYCIERGYEARFLELMPVGHAGSAEVANQVSMDEIMEVLSREFRLEPLGYMRGRSSRDFNVTRISGGKTGTVGFIASNTMPFCDGCRRLRLTARGKLIGCLARGEDIDIRAYLATDGILDEKSSLRNELAGLVESALHVKGKHRDFQSQKEMIGIGG